MHMLGNSIVKLSMNYCEWISCGSFAQVRMVLDWLLCDQVDKTQQLYIHNSTVYIKMKLNLYKPQLNV